MSWSWSWRLSLFFALAAVIFIWQILPGLGYYVIIQTREFDEKFAAVLPGSDGNWIPHSVQGKPDVYEMESRRFKVYVCWKHTLGFFTKEIQITLSHRPSRPDDPDVFILKPTQEHITVSNEFRRLSNEIYPWEPDDFLDFCERLKVQPDELLPKLVDFTKP